MPITITRPSGSFTSRDFDSWVIDLRAQKNAAIPQWTDDNLPSYGNVLLELFAQTLDVASHGQDMLHRQRFVTFVRVRRWMIALGKNVAFKLSGPAVASVDLTIATLDGLARVGTITIPAGTVIVTPERVVEFRLLADAVIPAGQIQVTGVGAENAEPQSDAFVAAGAPGLQVVLGSVPYVHDSAGVLVGVDAFVEVESFFLSGPTDKHFRVDVDDDDRATLTFGDNINGTAPTGAGTASYKTGGGAAGNMEANNLTVFRDGNQFTSSTGVSSALSVRNPSDAGGGVDRMSLEEARLAYQSHVRTIGRRSVTKLDFEDNGKKVRGVARAMMLTSDDDPGIDENRGELYIVPVGGGVPSLTLKTSVLNTITTTYPPPLTFQFTVEDPALLVVSFSMKVYLSRGITEAVARAAIEQSLDDFFALVKSDGSENPQIDFGQKIRTQYMAPGATQAVIPWSDLFDAVVDAVNDSGAKVVRSVDRNTFSPTGDVVVLDTEFPVLGPSIAMLNGDTGLAF